MIFNFRIVSDGAENFKREIKIDAQATFLDLKNAICDSVGYDKTMMDSFFICDDGWEKRKEITYEDMDLDNDQEAWLMDDAVLEDFIDDEGQKLLYLFDYMTDRSMFMEMTEMIPERTLKDPVCTLSLGNAPKQVVDLEEFDAQVEAKINKAIADDDLGEEFYGSDQYDMDEFEAEGYGEMEEL